MDSCYFSSPFGKKVQESGRTVDFDLVYSHLLGPVAATLGLQLIRADGVEMSLPRLALILGSEIMIADLTGARPEVVYEIGLRHGRRPSGTILISERDSIVPADLMYSRVIRYEVGERGGVTAASALQCGGIITDWIRQRRDVIVVDSPAFQLVPGLTADLPFELTSSTRRSYSEMLGLASTPSLEELEAAGETVRQAAAQIRSSPSLDPNAYLDLLRRARDAADWVQLIELADEAPPLVKSAPETRQLLALALNRMGSHTRAVSEITELITLTGGDTESFSILGRIEKEQFESARRDGSEFASQYLDRAILAYRSGFELNPHDFYAGLNLVTLLLERSGGEADPELEAILPSLRASVDRRLSDAQVDFWTLSAYVQVAAIARDWPTAERYASKLASVRSNQWQRESVLRSLEDLLRVYSSDPASAIRLRDLTAVVRRTLAGAGQNVRP